MPMTWNKGQSGFWMDILGFGPAELGSRFSSASFISLAVPAPATSPWCPGMEVQESGFPAAVAYTLCVRSGRWRLLGRRSNTEIADCRKMAVKLSR